MTGRRKWGRKDFELGDVIGDLMSKDDRKTKRDKQMKNDFSPKASSHPARIMKSLALATVVTLGAGAAMAEGGLGGAIGDLGGAIGGSVGGAVGSVGGVVSGVGDALGGGGNTNGLDSGLDSALGGGVVGGVVGGTVGTVGTVLSGTGGSTGGGGGTGTGGPGGGTTTEDDTTGGVANNSGTGSGGTMTNQNRNYATTCSPMGLATFNSFTAVDRSRTPLGQIQGVIMQGDKIVRAQFLTDSSIFGVRRCITIDGSSITTMGSQVVLPISQTQLYAKIGS